MHDKSKKSSVKYQAIMDVKAISDHLNSILAGLDAGTVHLKRGAGSVTLKPGKRAAQFSVEAKQSTGKESLSVKLKWRDSTVTPTQNGEPLEVLGKEPPPPKPAPAASKEKAAATIKKGGTKKAAATQKKSGAKKAAVKKKPAAVKKAKKVTKKKAPKAKAKTARKAAQ